MTLRNGETDKVLDLHALAQHCETWRQQGKKIVQCHGCFDFLHFGHLRHFKNAKRLGELLIVTVTPDQYIGKGAGRPFFPQAYRLEFIAALDVVDYVALNRWPSAVETIRLLRPDYFVKGADYLKHGGTVNADIFLEGQIVQEIGGKMAYTDDVAYASTTLIAAYLKAVGIPFPRRNSIHLLEDYGDDSCTQTSP